MVSEIEDLRAEVERERRVTKRLHAEVEGWEQKFPCDGACVEYPEEDCSRHGRKPSELWAMLSELNQQRQELRARLAAVEGALMQGGQTDRIRWQAAVRALANPADPA